MSKLSFPEVPEGNEKNEGDQTLMFDQQTLPFKIFQNEAQESLIFIRLCINDHNFIPGPAEKENSLARRKPISFKFRSLNKTKTSCLVQRSTSTGWYLDWRGCLFIFFASNDTYL